MECDPPPSSFVYDDTSHFNKFNTKYIYILQVHSRGCSYSSFAFVSVNADHTVTYIVYVSVHGVWCLCVKQYNLTSI